MSLIRARRERRQQGSRAKQPSLWKLLATLALVLFLIWYLSRVV